jgi:hypothetical protein
MRGVSAFGFQVASTSPVLLHTVSSFPLTYYDSIVKDIIKLLTKYSLLLFSQPFEQTLFCSRRTKSGIQRN